MTNWIKCSDRMPDKDGRYLTTFTTFISDKKKSVAINSFEENKWINPIGIFTKVLAWQELPEPAEVDDE